jgi:hypothetical protein
MEFVLCAELRAPLLAPYCNDAGAAVHAEACK